MIRRNRRSPKVVSTLAVSAAALASVPSADAASLRFAAGTVAKDEAAVNRAYEAGSRAARRYTDRLLPQITVRVVSSLGGASGFFGQEELVGYGDRRHYEYRLTLVRGAVRSKASGASVLFHELGHGVDQMALSTAAATLNAKARLIKWSRLERQRRTCRKPTMENDPYPCTGAGEFFAEAFSNFAVRLRGRTGNYGIPRNHVSRTATGRFVAEHFQLAAVQQQKLTACDRFFGSDPFGLEQCHVVAPGGEAPQTAEDVAP